MAMILTMVWGALHGHLVPWCWEGSFTGLSKISMIGHSMCCYWTKPLSSKSLWTTAVSVVSSSRKIFPIVAYSHIQSHTIIIQFTSVTQSCSTLCDPMNCSTPGLPVHHQLPEFTQTNIHLVGDAIQPSHPLLSPSPPALNPSQRQSLFQ